MSDYEQGYRAATQRKGKSVLSYEQHIAELEKKLQAVYDAGISGIGYVAEANYAHREREAKQRLHDAMYGDTAGGE